MNQTDGSDFPLRQIRVEIFTPTAVHVVPQHEGTAPA